MSRFQCLAKKHTGRVMLEVARRRRPTPAHSGALLALSLWPLPF